MVRNPEILQKFEDDYARNFNNTFEDRLRMLEAMRQHLVKLGLFPPDNPLEGIEKDIELARILNSVK